mgnify:CR=1 FL=1
MRGWLCPPSILIAPLFNPRISAVAATRRVCLHSIEFQKHGGTRVANLCTSKYVPWRAVNSIRHGQEARMHDAAFMLPHQLEALEFQSCARWSDDEIATSIIPEQSRQVPAS